MKTNSFSLFLGYALFFVAFVAVIVLGLMLVSVTDRRGEAAKRNALHEIAPVEMDAAKWGRNYPRQYDSWAQTRETSFTSKYGGSGHRDYLEETPANVILFAGFAFSKDYCQARGHSYAVHDVSNSPRVTASTSASCWYCKSPDVPRLIGEMGIEAFASKKFPELKDEITHAIGCYDCHEPNTMKLRVLRPAIHEGFQALGKNMEDFSHQEMRGIACGQCHSTYYFTEGTNIVTFPWSKGLTADDMEEYYKEDGFSDWTHPISKVKVIKMRHPDYELYMTSTHAARGVSCSDCHMPYKTEGAEKFSDHHIQTPIVDLGSTCVTCHRWSEDDTRKQIESIQDKVKEGRDRAELALAKAHFDIAACMEAGATDEELTGPREELRYAQMHWDMIAASNAMGFHAPQESQRILATALDRASQVRVVCARILAKHGFSDEVVYPDYGTKAKAQAVAQAFVDGQAPSLLKKAEK